MTYKGRSVNLAKIKEVILEIQKNQDLVKALYPADGLNLGKCGFAYLAYIDGEKKLPVQTLFSDDIAHLQLRLGFKKGLGEFLIAHDVSFTDLLFFLEAYKNHKAYGESLSAILYNTPPFKSSPLLDDLLKNTRGYIIWHYQLEGLIRIFLNMPERARQIREGLNRQDPDSWDLIKKFQFADGSTLFDVYNERKMAPFTGNPQYLEAYNLFNLITRQEAGMEWNDSFENPEKEKARLEKIISENPNDAEAHYKLGEVYEFMRGEGSTLKAIEYCEKAILIEPGNTTYLAFLIYLTLNFDDQKAFDALAEFIDLGPDEGDYYTERVIDELGCLDVDFALKYIENLRKEDKEYIAHTMERWIWNP